MNLNISSQTSVTGPDTPWGRSQTSVTRPGPNLRWIPQRADSYMSEAALTVRRPKSDPAIAKSLGPMTTAEKRTILISQLERSLALAVEQHLDVPSAAARTRAEALLSRLVIAIEDASMFEVFVADDGTIEITASPHGHFITIDIAPVSARTALVVQDSAGLALVVDPDASDTEVVRRVERAA